MTPCTFNIHKWSKWKDIEVEKVEIFGLGGFYVYRIIQSRTCSECGKLQIKRERI